MKISSNTKKLRQVKETRKNYERDAEKELRDQEEVREKLIFEEQE